MFSFDDRYLCVGGGNGSNFGFTRIYELGKETPLIGEFEFPYHVTELLASENGRTLFAGDVDGVIHVIDVETKTHIDDSARTWDHDLLPGNGPRWDPRLGFRRRANLLLGPWAPAKNRIIPTHQWAVNQLHWLLP